MSNVIELSWSSSPEFSLKKKLGTVVGVMACHTFGLWGILQIPSPKQHVDRNPAIAVHFFSQRKPDQTLSEELPSKSTPIETARVTKKTSVAENSPKHKTEISKPILSKESQKITAKAFEEPSKNEHKTEQDQVIQKFGDVTPSPAPQPITAPIISAQSNSAPQPQEAAVKTIDFGRAGVQWRKEPRLSIDISDLRGSQRRIELMIEANEKGEIEEVNVVESSGIASLDAKVIRAVRNAKLKPYLEDGIAYSIKAKLPFQFN